MHSYLLRFPLGFQWRILIRFWGGTVAQWLALLPHSVRVLVQFWPHVTVCIDFARSPCFCVGFLRVLRFPPTLQRSAG